MAPVEYGPQHPPKSYELYAAAKYIADKCFDDNLAFYKCKDVSEHPAKCLAEGKAVQGCVHKSLGEIERKASKQFRAYADCLDVHSLKMEHCRQQQLLFEAAMFST